MKMSDIVWKIAPKNYFYALIKDWFMKVNPEFNQTISFQYKKKKYIVKQTNTRYNRRNGDNTLAAWQRLSNTVQRAKSALAHWTSLDNLCIRKLSRLLLVLVQLLNYFNPGCLLVAVPMNCFLFMYLWHN